MYGGLGGGQVIRAVVAAHGVDEGERVEAEAEVLGLATVILNMLTNIITIDSSSTNDNSRSGGQGTRPDVIIIRCITIIYYNVT